MEPLKIALSKGEGSHKHELYEQWLKTGDQSVECVDLSLLPPEEAVTALNACKGLVLTGGPDVDPDLYDQPEDEDRCKNVDRARDKLEFALIQRARLINIPILGIGRGMHLVNVFLGGTLTVNLAEDKPGPTNHDAPEEVAEHPLALPADTMLQKMAGVSETSVISTHHQGIDRLSWYLKPCAMAPDGLIEAFEWGDPSDKGFLLGVQWHPERMSFESPMSGPVAKAFLEAAKTYVAHHRID
jgi:putative glutamine amidotransferase